MKEITLAENAAAILRARLLATDTTRTWYAEQNDLIGGWCVMDVDASPAESGRPEVADFLRREDAELIALLHAAAPFVLEALEAAIADFRKNRTLIPQPQVRLALAIIAGDEPSR